jgi:hypothetical protein
MGNLLDVVTREQTAGLAAPELPRTQNTGSSARYTPNGATEVVGNSIARNARGELVESREAPAWARFAGRKAVPTIDGHKNSVKAKIAVGIGQRLSGISMRMIRGVVAPRAAAQPVGAPAVFE